MKQFNKTVRVEVEVDSIAENLLSIIDKDFAHRELVAETIIGTAMEENRLGFIYNSLNGFKTKINFEIGQKVYCSSTYYSDDKEKTIGECEIVDINEFARVYNVKIKYTKETSSGHKVVEDWVKHTHISLCKEC